MALIEAALRAHALADANLSALIGERWYGPTLEQFSALPAVTVQCVSSVSTHSHDGGGFPERARYQFTAWAESHLAALDVVGALTALFDGARGLIGSDGVDVAVDRMWKAGRIDLGREPNQKVYKIDLDFFIDYR
jgi:hypothetical protein